MAHGDLCRHTLSLLSVFLYLLKAFIIKWFGFFATGWNILNIGLIIAMIMILVDVQEYITERVLKVFNFLGKMSMNMWLIHMFFIAYGYHLANPITDLVWIYLESLVAAYVVWKLYNRLCGCIK